jgi:hypothetical protein
MITTSSGHYSKRNLNGNAGRCVNRPRAEKPALSKSRPHLVLEHFFDRSDFFLNLAGKLFVLACFLQPGIVGDLARFLFDLPFHFMKLAFDLVFRTRFHLLSPCRIQFATAKRLKAVENGSRPQLESFTWFHTDTLFRLAEFHSTKPEYTAPNSAAVHHC